MPSGTALLGLPKTSYGVEVDLLIHTYDERPTPFWTSISTIFHKFFQKGPRDFLLGKWRKAAHLLCRTLA